MTKLRRPLLLLLLLYIVVIAVNLLVNYPGYATGHSWVFSISFSLSVTTAGWLGYMALYYCFFKRRLNWHRRPTGNLALTVILSGIYGVVLMVLSMQLLVVIGNGARPDLYTYSLNSMYAALFTMLLGLIINGQHFLQQWKKSTEDNGRMKTELIQSQHEALKNQVNPHFLFNALNTLAGLIPEQPSAAVQFVQGLSNIFRYSLQHPRESTVVLAKELKVASAFLFLNEQRFMGQLSVLINLSDAGKQKHIVVHALLTLLENTIKHNEISTEKSLSIIIRDEADYLVVANSYQPKSYLQPSLGLGLPNIVERYRMITDRPVLIHKTDFFTVKIPLITL